LRSASAKIPDRTTKRWNSHEKESHGNGSYDCQNEFPPAAELEITPSLLQAQKPEDY
jgi:hypothetical protein